MGCCADLRKERGLTACLLCSDAEVSISTSGSTVVLGAGAAAPVGESTGHLEAATHWSGPGGASAVGVTSGMRFVGAYMVGPGVVGDMMARPGGLYVDP